MCEKAVFFLPVNILTVWCAGFLGHTVYLDNFIAIIVSDINNIVEFFCL